MKTVCSLPCSQHLATFPYPQSDQSVPCPPSHFLKVYFNIILPSTSRYPSGFFSSGLSSSSSLYAPLPSHTPARCAARLFSICSSEYISSSVDNDVPHYAVSSNPLLPLLSSFIHSAFCLKTGRKPLPKRAFHIGRFRASAFK